MCRDLSGYALINSQIKPEQSFYPIEYYSCTICAWNFIENPMQKEKLQIPIKHEACKQPNEIKVPGLQCLVKCTEHFISYRSLIGVFLPACFHYLTDIYIFANQGRNAWPHSFKNLKDDGTIVLYAMIGNHAITHLERR